MTSNLTRIPLAIALTSVMALAVGCSNDRTAEDQAAMQPANDPAMTTPPAATTPPPATTPMDTTATDPMANDGTMAGTNGSDQPGTDTWITTKVKSSLLADSNVKGLDINVETVNGVVTLTGMVDQQSQVADATRIAQGIEGVTSVVTDGLTTR